MYDLLPLSTVDYRMIAVDILADKLKDQKLDECAKVKGKSPITIVSVILIVKVLIFMWSSVSLFKFVF